MQTAVTVYPLTNYTFGSKEKKLDKDVNIEARMVRLKSNYERDGMRRSVEGILLVAEHNHPHVLLLQLTHSFYRLPGGRLRPGEDEMEGLKRKLTNALSPTGDKEALRFAWDVGELSGTFWRPSFDNVFYPYLPSHCTRPKEIKKIFIVPLPDTAMFQVPRNMRLVAVPLYELYDNQARYGPVLASLPLQLSRLRLNLVAPIPPQLPGPPPGPPPPGMMQQQQQHQRRDHVQKHEVAAM